MWDRLQVGQSGSLWPEASSSVRLHGTLSGSCVLWQPLHNTTLTRCPALFSVITNAIVGTMTQGAGTLCL